MIIFSMSEKKHFFFNINSVAFADLKVNELKDRIEDGKYAQLLCTIKLLH